ncbi:MAG: sigma 54-interacting transcriptional regulator [Rhizobacter sp.]|nr:sigma 54-interacting transcriptional regulator [Chlorobiales bacterium]
MFESSDLSLQLSVIEALTGVRTREAFCIALAGAVNRLAPFDLFMVRCLPNHAHQMRFTVAVKTADGRFELLVPDAEDEAAMNAEPDLLAEISDEAVYTGEAFKHAAAKYAIYHLAARKYAVASVLRLPLAVRSPFHVAILLASRTADAYSDADVQRLHHVMTPMCLAADNFFAFEELERQEREVRLQLSIGNVLLGVKTRETLSFALAAEISKVIPCDLFNIWFADATLRRLSLMPIVKTEDGIFTHIEFIPERRAELESATDLLPMFETAAIDIGENYARLAEHHPAYRQARERFGIQSAIRLPLPLRSGMMVAMVISSRLPNAYIDAHLQLLQRLAPQIGLLLENFFAFEKIEALRWQVEQEKLYLQDELSTEFNFAEMIGQSPSLRPVLKRVASVAATDTTVLIRGETGTGKELVARAIHDASPRRHKPLVKINCATLPAQLIESELFGHEKGAFTGAHERRLGKFELADGGTIFLDEIGELPLELQPKLLRVLQEREVERLGGKVIIKINARILAATNRRLEDEIKAGTFRADLYYRLNVFPVVLPPLRERREDIAMLARHFLKKFSKKLGKRITTISEAVIARLEVYDWPGNIRELEHVIEQAAILAVAPSIEVHDLLGSSVGAALGQAASGKMVGGGDSAAQFQGRTLDEMERDYILLVLSQTAGRVRGAAGAAAVLGMKPTTLDARMKKLGIRRDQIVAPKPAYKSPDTSGG